MELECEARIHLHAAVGGRQVAAGWHLHHVGERKTGFGPWRQAVEIAMRNGDELGPAAPVVRARFVANIAAAIDRALRRDVQLVRGNCDQPLLELLRRMECGPAQHDRHAAADRALARQRCKRIRAHHADAVGIDFEHFADHRGHQGLVALSGRKRMNGRRDGAAEVDVDTARVRVGGGLILGI
jgi:hypothetical protein